MSTLYSGLQVERISSVEADAAAIHGLLRQQLRWSLLMADHPDIDLAAIRGVESETDRCSITVNGVTYDDCELEHFSWMRGDGSSDIYTMILDYNVDHDIVGDVLPRNLIMTALTFETGEAAVAFGDYTVRVIEETWDYPEVFALLVK